ncbi:response regulator [Dehalobacter sp. DCM]|uniref:response regulator n=1 Tax=Dehalobacter sp. DCM TaxID=2907827 RepID=UPI003081F4E8|nr:response regulator [Dehalobacter sp. DCM]
MKPVVMVVDDDPGVANLLCTLLISHGYIPVTASNGYDAINLLSSSPNLKPDMIITDYSMPVLNGREFIEKISSLSETKDIPVVMMSGSRIEEKDLPETANYKGLVTKPFKINTLLEVIRRFTIERNDSPVVLA